MTMDIDNMSVLDRRRIEALVLTPMIRAFEKEIGREKAHAIARRVIVGIAEEQGKNLSKRLGGDDLSSFSKGKDPWTRGGALEIETLEESSERVSFNVTRCRYAEMYREIGAEDLGYILSCGRDGALSKGFNPGLTLTRTQTIMEGAGHCDFRYSVAGDGAGAPSTASAPASAPVSEGG